MSTERFSSLAHSLWRALESYGRIRAGRELRMLADRYEARQPELAQQLRNASEYHAMAEAAPSRRTT